MSSVLESLRVALGRNSSQQEHDYLYPHARALGSGLNLRNLPMPPVDKVLTCLKMAKENARVRFFWTHEETSFSNYFLNVYSPSEATHADLVIVNGGLYWMFQQCKHAVTDSNQKADFEAQTVICRDNLETVLANLPFHQASKLETVSSMIMASLYCLETCKPSAAWGFVATASHMSQTLGMHSRVETAQDPPETKAVKHKLFWLLYVQEKALSLRLGRSSTIRDSDITIPFPHVNSLSEISYFSQLHKMKDLAHLQGKIYDQLYSSGALQQPQDIRTTRARCLAAELEVHSNRGGRNERLYIEALRKATSNRFVEAFLCTGEVVCSSLICLVYRAIPPDPNQGTIFGKECISSAHKALKAHRKWMSLVTELDDDFLESYVNMHVLPLPSVFCHIIETCNKNDLDLLESVIKTLESATHSIPSSGVRKEYRLFKALYDAASSYIEARLSTVSFQIHPSENASPPSAMLSTAHQQPVTLTTLSNLQSSHMNTRMSLDEAAQWTPDSFEMPNEVEVDHHITILHLLMSSEVMEIDPRGDIKLCVGETDPVTFTVCSRALARTSPVFERMLYGNFLEAKKPDHGEWTVTLPEDNATAMSLFLRISHGQFDHIPRTISIDDLYDLTVLSNYYDATRMLEPWVGRWMSSMEDNKKRTKESMAKCLGIAWEFGFQDSFAGTTRRMLMESDGSDDPDLQMVPDIVERISAIRINTIQALLDVINRLVQDLCVVDEKPRWCRHAEWMGPHRCESMILGSLTFCLLRAGLWPLPKAEAVMDSIVGLRRKMTGLVIHDIGRSEGVDHTPCNPGQFLLNEIERVLVEIHNPVTKGHLETMDKQRKRLTDVKEHK
ncbi:hypothetical protein KAF25_002460 [Fusarium avenaceum]|uniref:Xylanolytic transcriptional activator regulatory domain-containing protein n=1 Tax=Fusarium avenaceum TaxID=40199 RepID=A0A9P7H9E3_9HYPO|nr:hypothetical protein KAF25_002460 [Fusarium avenaceum]